MTKTRKRNRVHRVARGKPVTSSHITDDAAKVKSSATITSSTTAGTANGVHGFRWFTVCAPAGWDPASEEWEV
jgi:hypothetical protein